MTDLWLGIIYSSNVFSDHIDSYGNYINNKKDEDDRGNHVYNLAPPCKFQVEDEAVASRPIEYITY